MPKKKSYFTKDQREEITDVIVDALHEVVIPVLSDLSDDVKEVKAGLERLGNKVEVMNRKLTFVADRHGERLENHEKRIKKLEIKTAAN